MHTGITIVNLLHLGYRKQAATRRHWSIVVGAACSVAEADIVGDHNHDTYKVTVSSTLKCIAMHRELCLGLIVWLLILGVYFK